MKFTLATVLLLAGVATAASTTPAQDAQSSKVLAALKADPKANSRASIGADGVKAAAKNQAAILLTNNGDPGAVASGKAFIDAVNKIVKGGNKDEIAILLAAGVIDAKNQPIEAKPPA